VAAVSIPRGQEDTMNRILTISYGAVTYLIFLVAFLYAIGFVGNIVVPRSVDAGVTAPLGEAVVVNVLLLGLLAVQHSVMARPAFKRWWTRLFLDLLSAAPTCWCRACCWVCCIGNGARCPRSCGT
jgi:protein-S-isoprenylcysteine O-methyltransferase Ste14